MRWRLGICGGEQSRCTDLWPFVPLNKWSITGRLICSQWLNLARWCHLVACCWQGGLRGSASWEWQPFVHQSTKNSCCVFASLSICTSDRVLKTPTPTLCKDIYSRKTARAHFTLPSTTLSYKKLSPLRQQNIEKTALETVTIFIMRTQTYRVSQLGCVGATSCLCESSCPCSSWAD